MSLVVTRTYPDDRDEATREKFRRVTCDGVSVGAIVYDGTRPERVWGLSNLV